MTGEPDYRKSLREHDELVRVSRELIDFLEAPRPEPRAADAHEWASTLGQRLVALNRRLGAHFREEDRAGVLTRLAERYPRAAKRLQALHGQHDEIESALQSLVTASLGYAAEKADDPRLRRRTRELLETIARHQSEEAQLILELISTDVGTGG